MTPQLNTTLVRAYRLVPDEARFASAAKPSPRLDAYWVRAFVGRFAIAGAA